MDANEAYYLLLKKYPTMFAATALDMGSFFGFKLRPIYTSPNSKILSGPFISAVDKKTGNIYDYNMCTDPDLYLDAEEIPLDNISSIKI